MKYFIGMLSAIVLAATMMGCERDIDGLTGAQRVSRDMRYETRKEVELTAYKTSLENCFKRGGVIIFSKWDGLIVDCK